MKNPNRYGTCYRLKGTRRRPYIAKVFIGYNEETLRPTYKNLGCFETKEEGLMTLAEYHNNPEGTGDKTTLKELFNRWKETTYDDISKATQDNYNAAYKLMEELHEEPFRSIKKSDFTKVIRDTYKSRSTMAKMKTLIKQLSDYAQDERLIKPEENNAGNIKLPKEEKKKQEIFTENEIEMLIKNSSDHWVQSILILIYTGLRVSE